MHRQVLQENLRHMLESKKISLTDAATHTTVSKQYLSQFITGTSSSKREQLLADLCLLLEISLPRLYSEDPYFFSSRALPVQESPKDGEALPSYLVQDHLQELYRRERYGQLVATYRASAPSLARLSGKERALTELVAAKALVHTHAWADADHMLNNCLRLFQQRQTLQPKHFIPGIIDCYRYLALNEYLQGNRVQALKYHGKLVAKAGTISKEVLTPSLLEKIRTAFINAVIVAKQVGEAVQAAEFRAKGKKFFSTHCDKLGLLLLDQELALSMEKVAHIFPDLAAIPEPDKPKLNLSLTPLKRGISSLEGFLGLQQSVETDDERFSTQKLFNWKFRAYRALANQDSSALMSLGSRPPDTNARSKLFAYYLMTMAAIYREKPLQGQDYLNAMFRQYYTGNVVDTDYFLIFHCQAELALKRNHRQAALNFLLDSLWCASKAGEQEDRLRILTRLAKLEVHSSNGMQIIEFKIQDIKAWLKQYWGVDNIGQ